eukprot:TRINITY_DN1373_c0_g1_i12.p1 TRINITY_DN1373_c0_g1~~TRINITY_DN1373_c0_g1_i12.p1  ORF type:complete len:349 (+),score=74.80 TRINITY_DN1373_c0_g1_i12:143-1048(+)
MAVGRKDHYVGDNAQNLRGILELSYPIRRGIVVNWDDMEKLFNQAFYNEMKVAPEEHPLLISEPPLNPKANKEKMQQVMFETFNVPAYYPAIGGLLTGYSFGRHRMMVLDVGEGLCFAINIVDGHCDPYAIEKRDFGGSDLTEWLGRLLESRGHAFRRSGEMEVVKSIKERECYVSEDLEHDAKMPKVVSYKLPDGHTIRLGRELFDCPEALFQPYLVGREDIGVHELLFRGIMNVDVDSRRDLLDNVVLSGGTTLLPGFPERLQKELSSLASAPVRVIAPRERDVSVWNGGSILASMPLF